MARAAYLLALFTLVFVASLSYVPTSSAADACTMCKYVANIIEGFLEENATEQEIISVLDQLCALAPSSFKTECYQFLAQEVPAIITYIMNSENPGTVCGQLGFCPYGDFESNKFKSSPSKVTRR